MREVKKIGSNVIWKMTMFSTKAYCTCGNKLNSNYYERDKFCSSCGTALDWFDPDEDFKHE